MTDLERATESHPTDSHLVPGARYVLCVPRGCGFNDVMCQIWMSYQYALTSGRHLWIDTRYSGLADSLAYYLQPALGASSCVRTEISNIDWEHLSQMSCYPQELTGRLDQIGHVFMSSPTAKGSSTPAKRPLVNRILGKAQYVLRPSPESPRFRLVPFLELLVRLRTNKPNFRSTATHCETLVLHHVSGGGPDSLRAMSLFKMRDTVRDEIDARVSRLGDDYDAIHIRHTDYRTSYATMLDNIRQELAGRNVLVCSDNPSVIAETRRTLTASNVMVLAADGDLSPDVAANRPAHYHWHLPLAERRRRNLAMLTDLVGLAQAKRLFFAPVSKGTFTGHSGFAQLADGLRRQPDVLANWIGTKSE